MSAKNTKSKKLMQRFNGVRPENLGLIGYHISKARKEYRTSRNANHPVIEQCENFVNRGKSRYVNDIDNAIQHGWLKRINTGYLYIQLAR